MGQPAKHVIYQDGSWVVQVNGHAKSAQRFPSKYEAIKAAGVNRKGAPVIVHGKQGQVLHWFDTSSARTMKILDTMHELMSGEKPGHKTGKAA